MLPEVESNLYGAGLSPPLFVRVIKVPDYRRLSYEGDTVQRPTISLLDSRNCMPCGERLWKEHLVMRLSAAAPLSQCCRWQLVSISSASSNVLNRSQEDRDAYL